MTAEEVRAIRMPMIAMTTRSSMRVKALLRLDWDTNMI
jgi:hypothetical protein